MLAATRPLSARAAALAATRAAALAATRAAALAATRAAALVALLSAVVTAALVAGTITHVMAPTSERVQQASNDLRIGILLPSADAALAGARLGVQEAAHAARLFGSELQAHEVEAIGAAVTAAAESLIREQGVHAIIGGANVADADLIMGVTEQHGILFFNVGAPMDLLARRCSRTTFHVQPSDRMRRDALAAAGAGAGARALAWHPALTRFGAGQVMDRFRSGFGTEMTERAWAGWLAVKILFDASQRAGATDAAVLSTHLTAPTTAFDGHKGMQLSFRPATHQLRQPLYIAAGDEVIAEVPSVRDLGARTHAELLDTIGVAEGDPCTS